MCLLIHKFIFNFTEPESHARATAASPRRRDAERHVVQRRARAIREHAA